MEGLFSIAGEIFHPKRCCLTDTIFLKDSVYITCNQHVHVHVSGHKLIIIIIKAETNSVVFEYSFVSVIFE